MALPPNKIFQNKKHYDPGRLRHGIAIMEYALINDGYGGTTEQEQQILATTAGKEGVSEYKKAQLLAGYTNYDESIYFIIRNRKNFYPNKTMHIKFGGHRYTIIEVQELDDPCTFLKILCISSEDPESVNPDNSLLVNGYLNNNGILIDSQIYDLT